MSHVEEVDEHGIAKRKPLRADRYLLNRMSRTIVHGQASLSLLTVPKWGETMEPPPPNTQAESASSSGVGAVAKQMPIMVQSVRAKSCPTGSFDDLWRRIQ